MRAGGEVGGPAIDRRVQPAIGDQLADQPPAFGLGGGEPPAAHHRLLGPAQPGEAGEALRAAGAGDRAQADFRQSEDRRLGRQAEIAGQSEFEGDAHRVFLDRRDDRLAAALGRGDRPGEVGHAVGRDLEEAGDVAAGGEDAVRAADHDDPAVGLAVQRLERGGDLGARGEADDVERRPVERQRRRAPPAVERDPEAVEAVEQPRPPFQEFVHTPRPPHPPPRAHGD